MKGVNLTGSISVTIYRDNAAMFKSQVKSIPASIANTAYSAKIVLQRYNPD